MSSKTDTLKETMVKWLRFRKVPGKNTRYYGGSLSMDQRSQTNFISLAGGRAETESIYILVGIHISA